MAKSSRKKAVPQPKAVAKPSKAKLDRPVKVAERPVSTPEDTDNLIDFIVEVITSSGGDSSQATHDRLKREIALDLRAYDRRFRNGYKILLNRIGGRRKQGLAAFRPSPEALAEIRNDESLKRKMEEGQPLTSILGISDDAVDTLYQNARQLVEDNNFPEAADAFICLTGLRPDISPCWLGLARSEYGNHHPAAALIAYRMAIMTDITNIELYPETLRCCVEMNELDEAFRLIEVAEAYAAMNVKDPNAQRLRDAVGSLRRELKAA